MYNIRYAWIGINDEECAHLSPIKYITREEAKRAGDATIYMMATQFDCHDMTYEIVVPGWDELGSGCE